MLVERTESDCALQVASCMILLTLMMMMLFPRLLPLFLSKLLHLFFKIISRD